MLVRFKRQVSFVNAYPHLCGNRLSGQTIEPGDVFEELPMIGAGVKPDDIVEVPDPRDDELPGNLPGIVSACKSLNDWIRKNYVSVDYQSPVVAQRLAALVEAAALLPDALAVQFGADAVREARTLPELVTLVKRLKGWAATGSMPAPDGSNGHLDAPDLMVIDPPRPRLTVDLDGMSVTLDGVTHDVESKAALRWVQVLAGHPDKWLSSTELKKYDVELDGVRTDRLKKYFSKTILSLLETNRRKGSRLCLTQ